MKIKFINFNITDNITVDSKGLLSCGNYNISLILLVLNLFLFITFVQYKTSWSTSVVLTLFICLITMILSFRSRSLLPVTLYCSSLILCSMNIVLIFSFIEKYYIIAYSLIVLVIFLFDNLILVIPLTSLAFLLTLKVGYNSYGIPLLTYIFGVCSGIISILTDVSYNLYEDQLFYTTKGEYTKKFIWTKVELLNLILSFSIVPVVLIYITSILILKKNINCIEIFPLIILWTYSIWNQNKIKRIFKKG